MEQATVHYLSKHLRAIRQIIDVNQEELAEEIGFSRPLLSEIEQGRRPLSRQQAQSFLFLLLTYHADKVGMAPILLRMPGNEAIRQEIARSTIHLHEIQRQRLNVEIQRDVAHMKQVIANHKRGYV